MWLVDDRTEILDPVSEQTELPCACDLRVKARAKPDMTQLPSQRQRPGSGGATNESTSHGVATRGSVSMGAGHSTSNAIPE